MRPFRRLPSFDLMVRLWAIPGTLTVLATSAAFRSAGIVCGWVVCR